MTKTNWPPKSTLKYEFDLNPELAIPFVDNIKTNTRRDEKDDNEIG